MKQKHLFLEIISMTAVMFSETIRVPKKKKNYDSKEMLAANKYISPLKTCDRHLHNDVRALNFQKLFFRTEKRKILGKQQTNVMIAAI